MLVSFYLFDIALHSFGLSKEHFVVVDATQNGEYKIMIESNDYELEFEPMFTD